MPSIAQRGLAAVIITIVLGTPVLGGLIPDPVEILRRGDANNDATVDVSDVQALAAYLWQGGQEPPCLDQADANDDGLIDVADPSYLSSWLYQGGPAPPSPGPYNSACAADPTAPHLGCAAGCQ